MSFEKIDNYISPIEKYKLQKTAIIQNNIHKAKYDTNFLDKKYIKLYLEVK